MAEKIKDADAEKDIEYHKLPNGTVVTFVDSTHTYVVDGVEVPSITRLLDIKYGSSYDFVDPDLLKKASAYGTAVHNELSNFIDGRMKDPSFSCETSYPEVYEYFDFVEPIYGVEPVMTEQVVILYDKDNVPAACGRFDLLCKVKGKLTLADFKTTTSLNKQHIIGQLNLYLIAAWQSGYIKDTDLDLAVIHLVGDEATLSSIPRLSPRFYLHFLEDIKKKQKATEVLDF